MMKKIIGTGLVALLLLCGSSLKAQSRAEKAVAEAVENLRRAMVDADSAALDRLLLEELSYGHSLGKVEGKASLIGSLTSGSSDFVSIDLSEQTVVVRKKTAVVRHTLQAQTSDAGRPGAVKIAVLLVWQKDRGAWKLLARQAVRL